ncbi:hypothetical protein [Rhizobium sp. TRM95796]|uniref:hypothetical protein n=1 Tax=Rhizobium sp. TRM95796 TaxID=2979862 RepID=UPI0021E7D111|nr:hypothetical protein [Rhizobium sp. TRM95796]MCV3764977.1 hypothetical protein [Rhizobium sp. TRM95796]
MSSLAILKRFAAPAAASVALLTAGAAALAQDAKPAAQRENCQVRPDGQAAPAQPLTERLQDCNSVLQPKGLGDPDIVTVPPKVNDPMAIKPQPPVAPADPGVGGSSATPGSP